MKKQLNTEAVVNELKGASLFFTNPAPQPPPPRREEDQSPMPQAVESGAPATPNDTERPSRTERTPRPPRTPSRKARRFTRRHAFDIYDDQLETLRRLALEERMNGGVGSMSQMVREALDQMLKNRSAQGEEG